MLDDTFIEAFNGRLRGGLPERRFFGLCCGRNGKAGGLGGYYNEQRLRGLNRAMRVYNRSSYQQSLPSLATPRMPFLPLGETSATAPDAGHDTRVLDALRREVFIDADLVDQSLCIST